MKHIQIRLSKFKEPNRPFYRTGKCFGKTRYISLFNSRLMVYYQA